MSDEITITFLGTSSAPPQIERRQSSVAIKYRGNLLIVDLGEGAQIEMLKNKISLRKMTILLTHLHSDHTLGLMGLLTTRNFFNIKTPITIIGPSWTSKFLSILFLAYRFRPEFEISVKETTGGTVLENKDLVVKSFPVKHSIESVGYIVETQPKTGKFNPEKAKALAIPRGELWKLLQEGNSIDIDGRKINPEEVIDKIPLKNLKVVITGDTEFDENVIEHSKKADLLIHDATYPPEETERATKYSHSTCTDAALIAKKAKVKKLVLTHISQLHSDLEHSLAESKKIFPNSILAHDGLRIKIKAKD
ncbi:MAG: ribonuclease Z [Candidatus Heimdallarchaeota archaeon]|nr:ribonuclease Z [Candidatus Heimdallarchaeota archaeon]